MLTYYIESNTSVDYFIYDRLSAIRKNQDFFNILNILNNLVATSVSSIIECLKMISSLNNYDILSQSDYSIRTSDISFLLISCLIYSLII